MSLLTPTEAPEVILEVLPGTAVGASACFGTVINGRTTKQCLTVTCWTQSDKTMIGTLTESEQDFVDNKCYDCQYHVEDYEVYVNDIQVYDSNSDTELYFSGELTCSSPCPCYDNGLTDVSFPCLAGFDGPDDSGDTDDISLAHMRYDVHYEAIGKIFIDDASVQSAIAFDGVIYTGEQGGAVNTFTDHHICWGDVDTTHTNLNSLIAFFESSVANEDLTSFDQHNDHIDTAEVEVLGDKEDLFKEPGSVAIDSRTGPRALVCAPVRWLLPAFMQLSIAGCQISKGVASVIAYLFPQVAIDDDTVMDVWATDVTPVGTRLLFMQNADGSAVMIGAVPADFNLSKYEPSTSLIDKCKSLLPS